MLTPFCLTALSRSLLTSARTNPEAVQVLAMPQGGMDSSLIYLAPHSRCSLLLILLSEPISQFRRYDQCAPCSNISTTCQHLQRDTSHERRSADQSAIQTNGVRRQGQRVVIPQFGAQRDLRAFRDTDAAMGPTVSGTCATPRCTSQARVYASIYIRWH